VTNPIISLHLETLLKMEDPKIINRLWCLMGKPWPMTWDDVPLGSDQEWCLKWCVWPDPILSRSFTVYLGDRHAGNVMRAMSCSGTMVPISTSTMAMCWATSQECICVPGPDWQAVINPTNRWFMVVHYHLTGGSIICVHLFTVLYITFICYTLDV